MPGHTRAREDNAQWLLQDDPPLLGRNATHPGQNLWERLERFLEFPLQVKSSS